MTDTLFALPDDDVAPEPDLQELAPGQWRLCEVQVANWGTFDGSIYRIPVARQGHLLTGPSGSGKSSLLDAIAAVLTPDKWLRFNQAAQGTSSRGDQRSIISYVRGAWSRTSDENEDRVVTAYLRPTATWSGIVLQYEDGTGRTVSLARLFFLRGTSTAAADLQDLCLLDRAPIDLRDLEPYVRTGLETRRLQQEFPSAAVTANGKHKAFYTRLCNTLGIAGEATLRLLHRTQAAKSLDSLDQLFRDYMLDEPTTFALAAEAVTQFGELDDAHKHVVQLREQRDHLLELRTESDKYDAAEYAAQTARALASGVPAYQKRRGLGLAESALEEVSERAARLHADVERATADHQLADDALAHARRRQSELGGDLAASLTASLATAERHVADTTSRWQGLQRQLQSAGVTAAPTTEAEFTELVAEINRQMAQPSAVGPTHAELERRTRAKDAHGAVEAEIAALQRSRTTVPSALLAVRDAIAAATGLPLTALPFAAELIEIDPEHARWTGAIERVLRPLALSMLVRAEHVPQVRRWVDTHTIGARLVYEVVPRELTPPRPARSDISLVNRVRLGTGHISDWIAGQLSDRYDYACVESADELDAHDRAVTINGQIKTSRTRYEKDDRVRIDDRSRWVLGDREAKLEALIAQLHAAADELTKATAVVERAEKRRTEADQRLGALRTIRETRWADVDQAAANRSATAPRQQLDDLTRDDAVLRDAGAAVEQASRERDAAKTAEVTARSALNVAERERHDLERDIAALRTEIDSGAVPELDEATTTELDRRFGRVQRRIDRFALAEVGQKVQAQLGTERDNALRDADAAGRKVTQLATQFKGRWEARAADLVADLADRAGYLAILDDIVAHGLPDHEADFLRLLRNRSRDLVGQLVSDIMSAPREIEEKLDAVNDSLRRSPFDVGRFLRLKPKVRRTPAVQQFLADLRSVTEGSWGDDDLETAERRFATLAEIMRKLGSSDHIDRVWRAQCLDTRQHVTFLANEVDEHGHVHATYDSGAAMSGGQQQKLVVFCLAAALRYQLADVDQPLPRYGTVIFDEAFDKADSRYTRMALDVFVEFGFQLVLATPQKLLQTIEPYVGAATSVENPTRRRSTISLVPWRTEEPPA